MRLLVAALRPGVTPEDLLLHPVGRAAWVGLFATALNLLPGGQLDGGHILYSVASKYHRKITLAVALLLIPLGMYFLERMDHVVRLAAGDWLPPPAAAQPLGEARSHAAHLGRRRHPHVHFVFHAHAGHDPRELGSTASFSLWVFCSG